MLLQNNSSLEIEYYKHKNVNIQNETVKDTKVIGIITH